MFDPSSTINLSSCRICLSSKKPLCPLFKYKLSGNYAEMLTAIADVKVLSSDGLPEKICHKCCTSLEKAYLLKTVAERTDRKLRTILARAHENVPTKKIAFDSFTDIKSEIGPLSIKSEPKWEMEVDLGDNTNKNTGTVELKDIVIANTVIRKVDPENEEIKFDAIIDDKVDISWNTVKPQSDIDEDDIEYLDDVFHDDDDDDYIPPTEKTKSKFKKPKLCDIKVFKGKKAVVRKVKVIKKHKEDFEENDSKSEDGKPKSTTITCYPILKNGSRGPPILLKRPKDATVLKVHPNYKARSSNTSVEGNRIVRRDKSSVRLLRSPKPESRKREKLVCPVCGILTYTLGNHIATHEEKKKFTCTQCPRSFVQRSNLLVHMKQHSGIKDHICEVCGAGFYTQKSLVRHNLIHKGDRPFSCHLCTKKFIARCDLNRHLRIHAGYKPFKCTNCAMSFNAKHQLQNHERMHTGERPYTCQVHTQYISFQAEGLRRHVRSHTGDKRFACEMCHKTFVQSHHLRNHMIVHTGNKAYRCQVCNVAFSYKVNLNNHVLKVHGLNLKFKSIHTVTEEVLRKEMGMVNETRVAIAHIMPHLNEVPTPAAHETVHHTTEY